MFKNASTFLHENVANAGSEYYDHFHLERIPTESQHHRRRLAQLLEIKPGMQVLDVGCGQGEFLLEAKQRNACVAGIDISRTAVAVANKVLNTRAVQEGWAEALPFLNNIFDRVVCLGSMEHFTNLKDSLKEMHRVGKANCKYLFLVPNAQFIARRCRLFAGTNQSAHREETKNIAQWTKIFTEYGYGVQSYWADRHIFSREWITSRGILNTPLRAMKAAIVSALPVEQQYQIYFLCNHEPDSGNHSGGSGATFDLSKRCSWGR